LSAKAQSRSVRLIRQPRRTQAKPAFRTKARFDRHYRAARRRRSPELLHDGSWKVTDRHKMNLFVYMIIGLGLFIVGTCACVVGLLLMLPIMSVAHMYIYLRLTGQPVAAIGRGG
jgi:hypothetical protein